MKKIIKKPLQVFRALIKRCARKSLESVSTEANTRELKPGARRLQSELEELPERPGWVVSPSSETGQPLCSPASHAPSILEGHPPPSCPPAQPGDPRGAGAAYSELLLPPWLRGSVGRLESSTWIPRELTARAPGLSSSGYSLWPFPPWASLTRQAAKIEGLLCLQDQCKRKTRGLCLNRF